MRLISHAAPSPHQYLASCPFSSLTSRILSPANAVTLAGDVFGACVMYRALFEQGKRKTERRGGGPELSLYIYICTHVCAEFSCVRPRDDLQFFTRLFRGETTKGPFRRIFHAHRFNEGGAQQRPAKMMGIRPPRLMQRKMCGAIGVSCRKMCGATKIR